LITLEDCRFCAKGEGELPAEAVADLLYAMAHAALTATGSG
jgi:hypothetical protein